MFSIFISDGIVIHFFHAPLINRYPLLHVKYHILFYSPTFCPLPEFCGREGEFIYRNLPIFISRFSLKLCRQVWEKAILIKEYEMRQNVWGKLLREFRLINTDNIFKSPTCKTSQFFEFIGKVYKQYHIIGK